MKRILLLCYIHGFKGNDNTFRDFPDHLKAAVASQLPDHRVESVVYPKYETKGELSECTEAFVEWLKERVFDLRKAHLEQPWPPNDRHVGVILVAHSMGGFVASDSLFRLLDERHKSENSSGPMFPFIQGILTFDTPFNGLARSMFVYGAFSNYQKVSNVFNVMTALSAAAPASISRLVSRRGISAATSASRPSNPAWKTWQLIAVRTGTVGAIAAGGVAAYMHRKQIVEGMRSVRNLNKESVKQGYQQSVDAIGQGLAYVNRGNVGESFAWLSDHFTFVGALMKQDELNRRLERLSNLKGVGIRDFYVSLGENGYWSGGYFVPERTFCAIPAQDQPATLLFSRNVFEDASDEVEAHMSMFKPEQNKDYERMTQSAANLVITWFHDDTELFDDPKYALLPSTDTKEDKIAVEETNDLASQGSIGSVDEKVKDNGKEENLDAETTDLPDESPIDIAAAASLVPLPDDIEEEIADAEKKGKQSEERKAYIRYLFGVAEQTGTSLRSYLPTKLPTVDQMTVPKVSMPNMPTLPSVHLFSKKTTAPESEPEVKADGTEPAVEDSEKGDSAK